MIGRQIMLAAQRESNHVSTSDPTAALLDAGVELDALNQMIVQTLAAYAQANLSTGEAAIAAFASGFELGVRSARLEAALLDAEPQPV